ncbi:MAG TPA: hypothetical protein VEL31_08180, partial [Ktedonobacteraceae bacterium]|nr:hypothetical protein [Ktedonobacteraceae bacterium]
PANTIQLKMCPNESILNGHYRVKNRENTVIERYGTLIAYLARTVKICHFCFVTPFTVSL